MIFVFLQLLIYSLQIKRFVAFDEFTKSIEELGLEYEDEKNSMIAVPNTEITYYDDLYDEFDNRIIHEHSMQMIFFGPTRSFLRIDTETILHILMHTQKHLIPISRAILAWDIVTDGKTAAFLQGREFLAFDFLLNFIPEEDLYYVNFGNPSVFKFFSNHKIKLNNRKYGVLVTAYKRYFGNEWYLNGSHINELGYLLCGFSSFDLQKISPVTFRELNVDVLGKLDRCSLNQTKTLYNIATHADAYGRPYEWSSHEVGRLHTLLTCIAKEDISSISLESVSAIRPKVMKSLSLAKLQYFTKQQILRMWPATRRIYILRIQLMDSLDTSQITSKKAYMIESLMLFILSSFIFVLFFVSPNHF